MASNWARSYRAAQSVAEYSILVAVVVIAVGAMFVYAQRGLQGRYKDAVKAAQDAAGSGQYEPAVTETSGQKFYKKVNQQTNPGGVVTNKGESTITTSMSQDLP